MSLSISFQRFISKTIFGVPCYLFKASRDKKLDSVNKILIIKFWALGDSIVLLPLFDALRKKYPDAQIDVLAHKRNKIIFEGQKNIDNIIEFSASNILKNIGRYDLCIDAEPALNVSAVVGFLLSKYNIGFNHGIRSRLYNKTILFDKKQHMVQNYLDFARSIGIKYDADKLVPLAVSEDDQKDVTEYLIEHRISNNNFIVGISPGVAESVKFRMWPIENFAALGDELIEKYNAKIIFIDSKSNENVVRKIQDLMKNKSISSLDKFGSYSSIKKTAELMKHCDIIISNDSGPMHISASMGTKTIGLFGPNTPVLWGPYGKGNISIWKPKKGCPFIDNTNPDLTPKNLTIDQMTCMDAISVEDVMNAVKRLR